MTNLKVRQLVKRKHRTCGSSSTGSGTVDTVSVTVKLAAGMSRGAREGGLKTPLFLEVGGGVLLFNMLLLPMFL